MQVHLSQTQKDGSTLALFQYSPGWQLMGMRLLKLKPGLTPDQVRRINQKGGGIELIRQWVAPLNKSPGPQAKWTRVLKESEVELQSKAAD